MDLNAPQNSILPACLKTEPLASLAEQFINMEQAIDMDELEQQDNLEIIENQVHRKSGGGGRARDPIWQFFHKEEGTEGGSRWKCNDCPYVVQAPQADRLRLHKAKKCKGNSTTVTPSIEESLLHPSGTDPLRMVTATLGEFESKIIPASTSSKICGVGKLKSSGPNVARELKRIADALEESNRLKRLKLGLDPYVPFDGESPGKRKERSSF